MIDDDSRVLVLGWGASRVRTHAKIFRVEERRLGFRSSILHQHDRLSQLLGPVSNELLYTTMRKINNQDCEEASGGDLITNRMFCALSDTARPCVGDSGSPLIFHGALFGEIF